MNDFPLTPFLISLRSAGIRPGIRDYERIAQALQMGGQWNIRRLKHVLLALCVKNETQRKQFIHRFDTFFQVSQQEQARFDSVDIEKVLEELRTLSTQPSSAKGILTPLRKRKRIPQRPQKKGFMRKTEQISSI